MYKKIRKSIVCEGKTLHTTYISTTGGWLKIMDHSYNGRVVNYLCAIMQICPSGKAKELPGGALVFSTFHILLSLT